MYRHVLLPGRTVDRRQIAGGGDEDSDGPKVWGVESSRMFGMGVEKVTRVRVGLIGCGGISRAHVPGYRELRDAGEVVAVADVDRARAEERARELGCGSVYADYQEVLARSDVDAVDICLPHFLHAPVALAAIAAGKHVLVEKPIAVRLDEAEAMVSAADRAGVILQVGHNERFEPQYQTMKEVLKERALGQVFSVRADHNQNVVLPPTHWLRDNASAGGGVVIGSAIHRLDLLRWLFGEPEDVFQVQTYLRDRLDGEVAAITSLHFPGGIIAEVTSNWAVRHSPWNELLWIAGSEGSMHNIGGVHLDSARRPECARGFVRLDGPAAGRGISFIEEIRQFIQCARTGQRPLVDGAEGVSTLRLVLAAYRSAELGRPVRLAD